MKNLDLIVKLSDISWIQRRWEPKRGDRFYHPEYDYDSVIDVDQIDIIKFDVESCSRPPIFLPLGFNPETGNYQLDDLLMEAGGFESDRPLVNIVQVAFDAWRFALGKKFDNTIIAKLTWLNELVGGKE